MLSSNWKNQLLFNTCFHYYIFQGVSRRSLDKLLDPELPFVWLESMATPPSDTTEKDPKSSTSSGMSLEYLARQMLSYQSRVLWSGGQGEVPGFKFKRHIFKYLGTSHGDEL